MKLIPKYKHAGTLNKEWIKDRDINGNWGIVILQVTIN